MQKPKLQKIEHETGTEWRVIEHVNNYTVATHHFMDEQRAKDKYAELLSGYNIGGYKG